MATSLLAAFQMALPACWTMMLPSPAAAFAGIPAQQRRRGTTFSPPIAFDYGPSSRRRNRSPPPPGALRAFGTPPNGDGEEEFDPLANDRREGMADAFSALDSLTADDFDDLRPVSSSSGAMDARITDGSNMEGSARLFMEMQAELSSRGEEGVYDDILGDLSGDDAAGAPPSYPTGGEDATLLGRALDDAADARYHDVDGIGALDPAADPSSAPLTTADVSNDILAQEIRPSLSMDEFMNSALEQAVNEIDAAADMSAPPPGRGGGGGRTDDIAKTAEELLEDEELRRGIEDIFDRAGEKLRSEVEAMKREQEAVTQVASNQGLEYLEMERQRLSEAEESVSRLIQKVARETDEVQKAMEDLEVAKNEASGGSFEDTAIDLKRGGIAKQAALVGGLLFGSRAVTETILVVGSPYGEEHFVPAIVQAVVALACAAYFFLVK